MFTVHRLHQPVHTLLRYAQEAERERDLDERRRLLEERQRLEGEVRRAKQLEQDVILNRGAARPKVSLSLAAKPNHRA